jgi:hypothetical protein
MDENTLNAMRGVDDKAMALFLTPAIRHTVLPVEPTERISQQDHATRTEAGNSTSLVLWHDDQKIGSARGKISCEGVEQVEIRESQSWSK